MTSLFTLLPALHGGFEGEFCLLILFIFSGYSGQNKSERDLEKNRLEYEFNEQDKILNKLVEGKHLMS